VLFNETAPITWDNSSHLLEELNLEFALKQHDEEIAVGHFSPAFCPDLLPGMYSMLIGVVPKPHSTGLHLITDHSTGDHALNNLITHANSSIKLDNLQHFGMIL